MVNYKRTMEQASHLAIEGNMDRFHQKECGQTKAASMTSKEERLT